MRMHGLFLHTITYCYFHIIPATLQRFSYLCNVNIKFIGLIGLNILSTGHCLSGSQQLGRFSTGPHTVDDSLKIT